MLRTTHSHSTVTTVPNACTDSHRHATLSHLPIGTLSDWGSTHLRALLKERHHLLPCSCWPGGGHQRQLCGGLLRLQAASKSGQPVSRQQHRSAGNSTGQPATALVSRQQQFAAHAAQPTIHQGTSWRGSQPPSSHLRHRSGCWILIVAAGHEQQPLSMRASKRSVSHAVGQ
jgi:hypothetical protein